MSDREPFLAHARYEPCELLGRGAQGVVGRVIDREAPDRQLVAKVWKSDCFRQEALLGEFALLARLRIPGVVRAHDLGRDARTAAPFIVEEFVAGPDAATWVMQPDEAGSPIARETARTERLIGVLAGVAFALAGLHDAGFVHSDLKPAHVRMRHPPGSLHPPAPVLLDLGAAVSRARSAESTHAFTYGYAAPEVMAGSVPSPRSDLYGLGALAWAMIAGTAPEPSRARRALGDVAPWVRPSVAELIESLIELHPRDRPADAREILRQLGVARNEASGSGGDLPAPIGRERELVALLSPSPSAVRYVTGPSGAGKSHLARELVTQALLGGRSARVIAFPRDPDPLISRLIDFFRGSERAWPFVTPPGEGAALLLVLDELEFAPAELIAALDAYRCRPRSLRRLDVVATCRTAPDGADCIELRPLGESSFAELCRTLGVEGERHIREAAIASGKNPGWLVASAGRVPLSRDTALERVKDLSPGASELLAAIALSGGTLPETVCARICSGARLASQMSELFAASLVSRRHEPAGSRYTLAAPSLAKALATALASFETAEKLAEAWLAEPNAPAAALLAVAAAPLSPGRRMELYERAAAAARANGLRSEQIDALLALAAEPERRTPEMLCHLERLTRDAGMAATYPQVLDWLDEAARVDARLLPLSLRRRAEKCARDGDAQAARVLSEQALQAARGLGDRAAEAFALATLGLVALFRADWEDAQRSLSHARARLAGVDAGDPEEIARLDHNTGVVALYRGQISEAIETFERSLAVKRALGDRAGMRSCLMNLAMALGKASRFDEACSALDEAIPLARSLGQQAGRGWCLFARAEIEVRRRDPRAAARFIAEAQALDAALPAAIRADLVILRAHVKLLDGDGAGALAELAQLDPAIRAGDSLIDGRATVAEASAHLAKLPSEPRHAARLAIRAARAARMAMLPEVEAQGLDVLRSARRTKAVRPAAAGGSAQPGSPYDDRKEPEDMSPRATDDEQALWGWLASVVHTQSPAEMALELARVIVTQSGAERVWIAGVDCTGHLADAWGADLDGLEIGQAQKRIDAELLRAALLNREPLYQREVETKGGRGSRLALAAPEPCGGPAALRAVILIEHRFHCGRFDAVTTSQVARWTTLAALVLRLRSEGQRADAPSQPERTEPAADRGRRPAPAGPTTILPVLEPRRSFPDILGDSPALRRALARLDAAIDGELPVLLTGETGTGKELFARALHELGPRSRREFVAVNCGALPETLFEAELFGHARGSFTGADRARPGLLSRAEGGTLLLDELGELPLLQQAALLRTLESRRYRPIGSDEERPFDVRIVAATNRDLEQAVAGKMFRQDLLFRVNAIEIHVPPLRERADDIPALARTFLKRAGSAAEIAPAAMRALVSNEWPGNVRELVHQMQRLAALDVARIDLGHLPRLIRTPPDARPPEPSPISSNEPLPDDERERTQRVLDETRGNISHAAAILGLTRQGLKKRMVRLGMRPATTSVEKVS